MARNSHSIGEPLFPYETQPERPEEIASREEYRRRLAEYLKDPQFRAIEGFPIGSDEDILALSDPPYYTACPNPFLPEVFELWQKERLQRRQKLGLPEDGVRYRREPFAVDVSEGKNDPIYNAHSYHTKVPHKAIMHYILHYTDPNDVIFDGFCGTGMTGVAAQLCGDKASVEDLGYTIKPDGRIVDDSGKIFSHLGERKAILNDLSPAASFISYSYNTRLNYQFFEQEIKQILVDLEKECGWMYETYHPHCDHPQKLKGKINFTIWSDVFSCPQCGKELIYWEEAIDKKTEDIIESWICSNCGAKLSKSPTSGSGVLKVDRVWNSFFDRLIGKSVRVAKQVPVLINYSIGKKRYEKKPDKFDVSLIENIAEENIPYQVPLNELIVGDKMRDPLLVGISNVHHFYTYRNLYALSSAVNKSKGKRSLFAITALMRALSKMFRWAPHGKHTAGMSGTLYIPSISHEYPIFTAIERRIKLFQELLKMLGHLSEGNVGISCSSSSKLFKLADKSLDYIFIDPPFGGNLMYSELNYIWESWLKVFTNNNSEAIINNEQRKGLLEYQNLMESCFVEFYRLLKPGHWMTIEFHNSHNSVWNAIQEALMKAGFLVADVRVLDKQQGSFNQTTSSGAVKQDLAISAYRPSEEFEKAFNNLGGDTNGAWVFVRNHLEQLPLPTLKNNSIEPQAERMSFLLYDRLLAFHLVRGFTIPLSASEFYIGLGQRFLSRDGMYFVASQAAEYDRLRLKAERVEQLALFVTDEQSAIQWLKQILDPMVSGTPKTYSEIMPDYIKKLHKEKHEKMPELMVILEQNFLQNENGQWYMPNPDKQSDLDALRAKALLHEFGEYLRAKGKLKVFRSEAVRAGFSKAWKDHDYETIVKVGDRMTEEALQEDPKLKMYYDNALSRYQRGPRQEPLL